MLGIDAQPALLRHDARRRRDRPKGLAGTEKMVAKRGHMVQYYSLPERLCGASKWGV